jgi:hypothetical protein
VPGAKQSIEHGAADMTSGARQKDAHVERSSIQQNARARFWVLGAGCLVLWCWCAFLVQRAP